MAGLEQVLVRSKLAHPTVKVGRTAMKDPTNGNIVEKPYFREFINHECYMTPEEAAFLVNSPENRKARAVGAPEYWYPAGVPVAVAITPENPLPPALSSDQVATADPAQAAAAEEQLAELQKMAEAAGLVDASGAITEAGKTLQETVKQSVTPTNVTE